MLGKVLLSHKTWICAANLLEVEFSEPCGFLKALPSREEPDISLSIVNS